MSPAIADLQFEAPAQSRLRHLAACLTVWTVLVRAVITDLRCDVAIAVGRSSRREVWLPALACYLSLIAIQTYRALGHGVVVRYPGRIEYLPLPAPGDGLEPYVAGTILNIGLTCAAYAAAVAIFRLRRANAGRAAVTAVLLLAAAATATARITRPIADTRDLFGAAVAMRGQYDPNSAEPLADIIATDVIPQRANRLFSGGRETTTGAEQAELRALREIAFGINVLAFGLAGFALAQSRGLWLAIRGSYMAAGILVLSWALPIVHMIIWPYGTPQPSRAVAVVPELLVVPLIACLSLAIRPYRRRIAY